MQQVFDTGELIQRLKEVLAKLNKRTDFFLARANDLKSQLDREEKITERKIADALCVYELAKIENDKKYDVYLAEKRWWQAKANKPKVIPPMCSDVLTTQEWRWITFQREGGWESADRLPITYFEDRMIYFRDRTVEAMYDKWRTSSSIQRNLVHLLNILDEKSEMTFLSNEEVNYVLHAEALTKD